MDQISNEQTALLTLPDTNRDTSNHSRLLLPARVQTVARVRRRPGPFWKSANGKGRRTAITSKKERIQHPRTLLQQLLGQEERPTIRRNQRHSCQVLIDSGKWCLDKSSMGPNMIYVCSRG